MNDNNDRRELVGYCKECKDPIFLEDDFQKRNGHVICSYCLDTKHKEELNFEED